MILIIGIGLTGLSVARFLARQEQAFIAYDDNPNPKKLSDFLSHQPNAIYHQLTNINFSEITQAVLSPGIPPEHSLLKTLKHQHIKIVSDIDLFSAITKKPIIGVTGSNGKSTVTHLLSKIFQAQNINAVICGNVGIPVLDALDNKADIYILELSSYQLDIIQGLTLACAIVLNITPDHLDRYKQFEHYIKSKLQIYQYAKCCVVDSDEPYLPTNDNYLSYGLGIPKTKTQFGTIVCHGSRFIIQGDEELMPTTHMQLIGIHNIKNVLASLTIGYHFNLNIPYMIQTIVNFKAVAHRLEWIADKNDIHYYNDSKSTNTHSTLSALNAITDKHSHHNDKIVLILGGIAKKEDYQPLITHAQTHCKQVILIGQSASALSALFSNKNYQIAEDLLTAIYLAKSAIKQGVVLFSPACASFDMFDNFEHRGKVFTQLVKNTV